ncbi:MAG: rod shape-determining protein MreC [Roseburia sp.]|nr:rod shape-determining protein MreC [Roseburia sp.]
MKKKHRRRGPSLHPKYIYVFLSILCAFLVVLSFKFSDKFLGFKTAVGDFVSPMQSGINTVGKFISDKKDLLTSKEKLLEENRTLKERIDALNYDNKVLAGENQDLDNYRELFELDQKYPDYPTKAATVIGRDGNNWFNLFTIDKGKEDGVDVDMNVIAGNGLVGIVSEAGNHYAKVRSIIDDKSNVSSMFENTGETCMVKGNMQSIYKGYIDVTMISNSAEAKDGDAVVTSRISDKFLPGLLVGYISGIKDEMDGLSKTANLTPAVSFDKLETVLIITTLKDSSEIEGIKNYD